MFCSIHLCRGHPACCSQAAAALHVQALPAAWLSHQRCLAEGAAPPTVPVTFRQAVRLSHASSFQKSSTRISAGNYFSSKSKPNDASKWERRHLVQRCLKCSDDAAAKGGAPQVLHAAASTGQGAGGRRAGLVPGQAAGALCQRHQLPPMHPQPLKPRHHIPQRPATAHQMLNL